jgi:8-oxo-dGTP pyrophosphatase MutT (NUDIX family)
MNDAPTPSSPAAARPRALRPRDAATLIIVDRGHDEPRVLMGKRHAGHRFMPGKFVFPGGAVEPGDRRMSVAGPLAVEVEAKLLARMRRPTSSRARALALAAIRETFEETGLAIGVADVGKPENPPPGAWERFAATGVYPALDRLDLLARAITPPGRPKRFDARFFVVDANAIAGRVEGVIHPEAELVELVWTPLAAAQNLNLPDITRRVLEDLEEALKSGMDPWRPRPFYRRIGNAFLREDL